MPVVRRGVVCCAPDLLARAVTGSPRRGLEEKWPRRAGSRAIIVLCVIESARRQRSPPPLGFVVAGDTAGSSILIAGRSGLMRAPDSPSSAVVRYVANTIYADSSASFRLLARRRLMRFICRPRRESLSARRLGACWAAIIISDYFFAASGEARFPRTAHAHAQACEPRFRQRRLFICAIARCARARCRRRLRVSRCRDAFYWLVRVSALSHTHKDRRTQYCLAYCSSHLGR